MDFKKLGDNLGLNEEEFYELAELFIVTASSDIKQLRLAHDSRNALLAAEAAHSLKGASGNLGFLEFWEIAGRTEEKAQNKCLDDLDEAITILTEKLKQIGSRL